MDWIEAKEVNQNLLRGAKSIADKIDLGCVIMPVRDFEAVAIEPIVKKISSKNPDIGIHFYKNRGSKYKDVILWCSSNLGTCKIKPLFLTNYDYHLLDIEDLNIIVHSKKE